MMSLERERSGEIILSGKKKDARSQRRVAVVGARSLMSETRTPEITVFSPIGSPSSHKLVDDIVTIGRASECTIPVKDRYLSRKHAEIVHEDAGWVLKDSGSANGTYLNGARVEENQRLKSGDRIRMGETELLFLAEHSTDRFVAVADPHFTPTIAIPIKDIEDAITASGGTSEKLHTLNVLAMELIEDPPMDRLFGFIVDRVMDRLQPSRAAIGLLTDEGTHFSSVEVRRRNPDDGAELTVSHTLLEAIVKEKKALAFVDVSVDEKLSKADSIVMQGINSVVCAPLTVADHVVGLLYVDYYFTQKTIAEDDVRLVGQIARLASMKLENTRLRDSALQKRLMDEELRMASTIQQGLLPLEPPRVAGYSLLGMNEACRTVSGDYYDFIVRPDGRLYFVIADVSGKGVTAALLMAGIQAAFRIFTKSDPTPAQLVSGLNGHLRETIPRSKFVTMFVGRLDPATGRVEYCNAGHVPPLHVAGEGVAELPETDIILGPFANASYHDATFTLESGDAVVLFTDGLTEAENDEGEEFSFETMKRSLATLHGRPATEIVAELKRAVLRFTNVQSLADDLTMVVVGRNP